MFILERNCSIDSKNIRVDHRMEVFLSAVKDLIKYKIVSYINTGDRTLDNLLNTVLIAVVSIVFGSTTATYIYMYYYRFKYRYGNKMTRINANSYDFYEKSCKDKKYKYITWSIPSYKEFTGKFINYYYENFSWKMGVSNAPLCNMNDVNEMFKRSYTNISSHMDVIARSIKPSEMVPIYVCESGNTICLTSTSNNSDIYIAYENKSSLIEFIEMINKIEYNIEDNDAKQNKKRTNVILYYPTSTSNRTLQIFEDRNFDQIISRYKDRIITALDDFIHVNKTFRERVVTYKSQLASSIFNGFGSYNYGLMLYGEPGTGKTSMIKAICNYLNRNAVIVDLKRLKTKTDFSNIFDSFSIDSSVFVFEEIDCVEGVLDRSLVNYGEQKQEHKTIEEQTKERYMSVLQMRSAAKTKEAQEALEKELSDIREEMRKNENRLTIDTMLTVLDGVCEMRNRCIIATTNYIEKIDKALIREGRFDHKIHLGKFNCDEIRQLLLKMFDGNLTASQISLLNITDFRENEFTPVNIINIVQQYRNINKVVKILSVPHDDSGSELDNKNPFANSISCNAKKLE